MQRTASALAGIALAATVGTANAADMAVKARPVAVAAVYDWTGFYIGGHVGGIWGRAEGTDYTGPLFPAFITTLAGPFGPIPLLVPGQVGTLAGAGGNSSSVMGGGQAGYNWQSNRFVFGVEGDGSGMRLRSGGSTLTATRTLGGGTQTVTVNTGTDIDWMASLRLRFGYAADRALFYVTGGGAAAGLASGNGNVTVVNGPTIVTPAGTFTGTGGSGSSVRYGWTVGAGVEWAVTNNWRLGAEYRHSDFGRVGTTFDIPSGFAGVSFATGTTSTRLTTDQATLRLNYAFTATPVVARY